MAWQRKWICSPYHRVYPYRAAGFAIADTVLPVLTKFDDMSMTAVTSETGAGVNKYANVKMVCLFCRCSKVKEYERGVKSSRANDPHSFAA